jgi:hypothetical protein
MIISFTYVTYTSAKGQAMKQRKGSRWYLTDDQATTVVNAPADQVYALVADLTRMGEWSPECARVEWLDGATGPAVGARFVGHNRSGPFELMRWSRNGRVLAADSGREFAFVTEEGGREGVTWRYRFEEVEDGTRVTESYHVDWIPMWARIVDVPTNRYRQLQLAMRQTLAQLKNAAEESTTIDEHA